MIGLRFFVGPIRDLFSQLKKKPKKQIFVRQNSKFSQISKSPEEIPRTQVSYFEVRKSQLSILTHNCHRIVFDFDCMLSKRSKTKQDIFCEFMNS